MKVSEALKKARDLDDGTGSMIWFVRQVADTTSSLYWRCRDALDAAENDLDDSSMSEQEYRAALWKRAIEEAELLEESDE